jgi:predicted CXXCH cytochrome family protein
VSARPLLAAALAAASCAAAALAACGDSRKGAAPAGRTDTGRTAREAAAAFYRPDPDRIPHREATNPGRPWGDYVGSRACAPCHADEYERWRDSFHSRTLYDAVEATVIGDFASGTTFSDPRYGFVVRPWKSGGKHGMRIERGEGAPDTYGRGVPANPVGNFEVLHAFGNRRHQPYVTRAQDGRHWVLPVYWNDVTKTWMWDGWRPYVTACAHCHVTGIRSAPAAPGGDALPATNPPRDNLPADREGWAEGAVGCEVCHGTGRAHVEAVARMGEEGYRAHLAAGGEPTIYDPGKEKDPRVRRAQCDACHDFFSESPVTWVPGPRGYDHAMGRKPITPADSPNQFWGDGTPMAVCTVGAVFEKSLMSRKGVECRDCHDAHGTRDWAELVRPLAGNALCLGCHEKAFPDAKALEAHTHHPAAGPGSLCHECHMPRDKRFSNGVQVMSAQLHSHAFSIPTGDESPLGPGPSCLSCHTDRDTAWVKSTLLSWR